MSFKPETIVRVKRAIIFGEEIRKLFANVKEPKDVTPPLQNALMFCLKAIGSCIDKAVELEQINLEQQQRLPNTLIFWRNMHYLRNRLIHHFDKNMLNVFALQPDELALLFNICKNAGQIVFYLRLVANNQTTDVDLRGQKFKVFLDIYELADLLAKHNPRELHTQITQFQYLQAMTDAIGIIFKHIIPNMEDISMKTLGAERYYALHNLLECIATLGNPNALGATQRINDQSRSAIFSIEPKVDGWLRGLGQSRIKALHESELMAISNDEVRIHLGNLQLLHRLLLDPVLAKTTVGKLQDRFGIYAPTGTPPGVEHPHP